MAGLTPSLLKELQSNYGFKASKALGQNFLVDPNLCTKIAHYLPVGSNVLEIGPGIGSLTLHLARQANKVIAIELDKHLLNPLNCVLDTFGVPEKVDVINQDIMKTDLELLCSKNNIEYIFGNLPYNISAPLLADISRKVPNVKCVVAMVQKEVGERLSAKLGTRAVGAITYKCQFFMEIENIVHVPKMSFIPRPHVDSVVIKMDRRADKDPRAILSSSQTDEMFELIDTAFAQRRKMLRQSLKIFFGSHLEAVFELAKVDPTLRPEQLTSEDFLNLYTSWVEQGNK